MKYETRMASLSVDKDILLEVKENAQKTDYKTTGVIVSLDCRPQVVVRVSFT